MNIFLNGSKAKLIDCESLFKQIKSFLFASLEKFSIEIHAPGLFLEIVGAECWLSS